MPNAESVAREALEALRLTVEYVGLDVLHPVAGWSWYDVLSKQPEYADWLDSVVNPRRIDGVMEPPPTNGSGTPDE